MSSKELVVSQSQHETKVGILEEGQLVEVYFQRANEYSLAGSIHKGRVTRVLPGMQSAFVDLGLERDTFLYVSDFFEEHGEELEAKEEEPQARRGRGRDRDRDRDRGRDRDRDRDRQPAREAQPAAAPVVREEPVAEEEAPAAIAAEPPQESDRDGRGRRSRRRRRGGRGIPDSKYAVAGRTAPEEAAGEGEAEGGNEEPREYAKGESGAGSVEPPSEVILLPGESLAKYRRAVTAEPQAEPQAEAAAGEAFEEAEAEAYELAAEDAVEQILDRVEALDEAGAIPEPEPEAEVQPEAEIEAGEPEAEAEIEPAAAEESTEEPVEETAPVEVSGEEPQGIAQATEDEEGVEPARMPQSLTATLRAQGGRLGHRVSRRTRRRGGRGGQNTEGETRESQAETPAESAEVRPAEPERAERPEGSERSERGERAERSERADRGERSERGERTERREKPPLPSISDLLKEGQEIIVQIAKEPLGQKGARITSHIALPGRYVVYMPTVEHFGVSRKISTEDERLRLKRILQKYQEGVPGGYIMRTAGEGRTEEEIARDMQYLARLWQDIREKADKRRAPALLHHDVEVVERLLRDQLTEGFKAVWVDSEDLYEQVLHAVERFAPALLSRVKLYTRPEPIFDAFGITQELEKALRPKVWLKSGGYIVINQTEALVAIDVNTGKYVGKSNRLEDTIVKTNVEAVKEIVRQMRLRDLGGIIVVDFIDMDERKNRQKVMQALEDTMKADKAPYKILQFNDFGLVAITRKRVKQSLERALCAPCPYCEGAGYVKSVQTVINEIVGQAQKYAKVVDGKDCLLRVNPEVSKVLKSVENKYLEELEQILGRPVLVTADPLLHQDKFDLT